jgi:hypothetical protein
MMLNFYQCSIFSVLEKNILNGIKNFSISMLGLPTARKQARSEGQYSKFHNSKTSPMKVSRQNYVMIKLFHFV